MGKTLKLNGAGSYLGGSGAITHKDRLRAPHDARLDGFWLMYQGVSVDKTPEENSSRLHAYHSTIYNLRTCVLSTLAFCMAQEAL